MMVDGAEENQLKGPIDELVPYTSSFCASHRSVGLVSFFFDGRTRSRYRGVRPRQVTTGSMRPPPPAGELGSLRPRPQRLERNRPRPRRCKRPQIVEPRPG
jgi:hypothetical protein